MTPSSMLQPSPISTTLAFSSRVVWLCSVALILSISAFVITVAVVGFPALGCAYTTRGIRTDAASTTFTTMFLMSFLLHRFTLPAWVTPIGGEVYARTRRGFYVLAVSGSLAHRANGPCRSTMVR